MTAMTTHERFTRMFEHKEADRIPVIDSPWSSTIERWHREGMPEGVDFADFFDLDHVINFAVDNSPLYEEKVLEETEEYKLYTTKWGVTMKSWKHAASTPEYVDFTVTDPDAWEEAKKRMTPTPDRINWGQLEKDFAGWRDKGAWVQGYLWFGFDVTHSWMSGTEEILMAILEDPEWVSDMFNHYLDVCIDLFEMIYAKGYKFDSFFWPDDMGYKHSQFFSLDVYREILKPVHKRAIDWIHSKGAYAHLHSCGDVNPFVPELIDIGLDALNPLEVKAGMNPVELKEKYGNKLVFHGGTDALLYENLDKMKAEMERTIPVMKKNGGFIWATDHSVPDNVSVDMFREITDLAKKLGSYE